MQVPKTNFDAGSVFNKYKDMLKMFPDETEETLMSNFQNSVLK